MNRIALAILTLVASTGAVIAAPVLKSEVTVIHGIVTVGDMFDNPGVNSERALFLSPAPGTTGTVSLEAVKEAATLAGITDYLNTEKNGPDAEPVSSNDPEATLEALKPLAEATRILELKLDSAAAGGH